MNRRGFIGWCLAALAGLGLTKSQSQAQPAELRVVLKAVQAVREPSGHVHVTWHRVRMMDLRPGDLFRFLDEPREVWKAVSDPYPTYPSVWGIQVETWEL